MFVVYYSVALIKICFFVRAYLGLDIVLIKNYLFDRLTAKRYVNLWWGLVMLIFGILLSAGGYISARRQRAMGDTMQSPQSESPRMQQENLEERRMA